jgi:hypothetical protein
MTIFRYPIFLALGLAFCVGCGDSSSQSWESGKSQASAGKTTPKSGDVADNDAPANNAAGASENPHGMTNPHGGMQMPGQSPAAVLENDGKLDLDTAHWTVPKTWVRKGPGMMLLAEYAVPKSEGDKEDGRLTVSQAGGSVESNLERWKGQFAKLDKQNQESIELDKLKVTLIDLSGTFNDSRGMMGPSVTRPDYRMLAAIVEMPNPSNPYFIKCYGPQKTMAAHADEIKQFIRSMKVDK